MIRRLVLVATVVAVAAVVTAGCGAGSSSSDGTGAGKTSKDSAVLGFQAEPANLDFTTTDGAAIPQVMLDNVYQGLVKLDSTGKVVPQLAKSWTVSRDRKTYDFQLNSGVTFSNGDKFTADDVKFSIDRVKSGAWKISLKTYMDVVKSVTVVSPTEVKVTLSAPSNDWLFRMTTRIGAMFSPNGVADLANKSVGTGPYTMTKFTRGDSIVLTRRADYWGQKPALQTVTFRYFKDSNAENSALLSGSIDGIISMGSPDSLSQFKSNKQFDIVEGTTNGEVVLSMNNASGVFTDKRLRQAVCYAIDRKALVQAADAGYGTLIGSMVPPSDPWYQDLSNTYPYDPAKAKALLAEAGKPKITVRFRVPNLAYALPAAQVVKSDLAAVGITAKIDVLQFPAQWLDQVFAKHDYDMSVIEHVEARDIATYADPTYYWGYNNPKVQKLLRAGDAGTAQAEITAYQKVASILAADAVSDWLYLYPRINVLRVGLQGVPPNDLSEALDVTGLTWK